MEQVTFSGFLAVGLLIGFVTFLVVFLFMVFTELLYGIAYLTLGLDAKNAPKVLQSNPLRKHFFCFWPKEYKHMIEDGAEVSFLYFTQGFIMTLLGPAMGLGVGWLLATFYFYTFPMLVLTAALGVLFLIRFVATSTWGNEGRVKILEDKK